MQLNQRKAAIIGCGFVGSATAFCLMQSGLFSEIVLQDVDKDKAEGEAMDITHGTPFAGRMKIYAGNYNDMMDAAVIIITAGANQKEGETRLDLVKKNKKIFEEIIPEISNRDYEERSLKPVCYMYQSKPNSFFIKNWILGIPGISILNKKFNKK